VVSSLAQLDRSMGDLSPNLLTMSYKDAIFHSFDHHTLVLDGFEIDN
jgi:hypothetical protein